MKNKKNIKILNIIALTFACFFLFQMEPKARLVVNIYNGGSDPQAGAIGKNCPVSQHILCPWGNTYTNGIRVGVVWCPGSDATQCKRIPGTKTLDIWDKNYFPSSETYGSGYRNLKFENIGGFYRDDMIRNYGYVVDSRIGSYSNKMNNYAQYLENFFMKSGMENGKKTWPIIDEFLEELGTSRDALSKLGWESKTVGLDNAGFRLFIEPLVWFKYRPRSEVSLNYVLTITEFSRLQEKGLGSHTKVSNDNVWSLHASAMYTVYPDVGITPPTQSQLRSIAAPNGLQAEGPVSKAGRNLTSNTSIGLGLHIIDLTEAITPTKCDYEKKDDFPTSSNDTDKKCCAYFIENPQEIPKPEYISDAEWSNEKALEKLYKDYPVCEPPKGCTLEGLPTYEYEQLEECCIVLEEQYRGNKEVIEYITPYCGYKAGTVCGPDDYTINLNTPISCTTSTTGSVSDIDNWKCIFDSTNQPDSSPYSKFYLVESTSKNPYCSVYCREDINYEFPSNSITVDAGRHFTVNNWQKGIENWAPINFVSKRECRTTTSLSNPVKIRLDVDAGYKELYNAIQEYYKYVSSHSGREEYDPYDSRGCRVNRSLYHTTYDCEAPKRLLDKIIAASQNVSCTTNACDYEKGTIYSGIYSDIKYTIGYNYDLNAKINVPQFIKDWTTNNDAIPSNWRGYNIYRQLAASDTVYSCRSARCQDGEGGSYETTLCSHEGFYNFDDQINVRKTWSESCDGDGSPWPEKRDDYYNAYKKAWDNREKAEDYIWACNNWEKFNQTGNSTSIYASEYAYSGGYDEFVEYEKFSPDLKLNYNNSEWKYSYNENLKKILKQEGTIVNEEYYKFATSTEPGEIYSDSKLDKFLDKHITYYDDEHSYGKEEYIYPINEQARAELEKSYTYKLKDNKYRYIYKPQGISKDDAPQDPTQVYIDLGYENLPVHYMTPTGTYPITLVYWQFSEDLELVHKFDEVVFGTDRDIPLVYSCTYSVNNKIIECVDPPCDEPNPPIDPEEKPKTCEEKCANDPDPEECLNNCNNCVDLVKEECQGNQTCIDEQIDRCFPPKNPDEPENPYDPTNPVSCALACIGQADAQTCIENCSPCYGAHCNNNTDDGKWRGLTIIYRPISLEDPFPGIKGENRDPGANWLYDRKKVTGEDECIQISGSDKWVCTHINFNRNVDASQIYFENVDPMYEFTLTPAIIMNIRNYNDKNQYDDFNMDCQNLDGTGKWQQCRSKFLRDLNISNWSVQIGNKPAESWIRRDTCGMHTSNWDQCIEDDLGRGGAS